MADRFRVQLAASTLLLTTDVAELLASSTLQVGPARAVAGARQAVGPPVLGDAMERLPLFGDPLARTLAPTLSADGVGGRYPPVGGLSWTVTARVRYDRAALARARGSS